MDNGTDRLSRTPPSPVAAQPARGRESGRDERAGTRFAEQLAAKHRALAGDGEGAELPRGALARLGRAQERFGGKDSFGQEHESGSSQDGSASAAMNLIRAHADPQGSAPLEQASPPQTSDPIVDRMAAAIAELQGKATEHAVRIAFPAGGIAEGALVTRDASSGALSIRVVGLVTGVSERRRTELEKDLRLGLDRRRIAATLQFEPPAAAPQAPLSPRESLG